MILGRGILCLGSHLFHKFLNVTVYSATESSPCEQFLNCRCHCPCFVFEANLCKNMVLNPLSPNHLVAGMYLLFSSYHCAAAFVKNPTAIPTQSLSFQLLASAILSNASIHS